MNPQAENATPASGKDAGVKDATGAENAAPMVAPATRAVNPDHVSTFLHTLLPDPLPEGLHACLWFNPGTERAGDTYTFIDADRGAALVAEHGDGRCCYWGVGLASTPLPIFKRLEAKDCAGLLGIGADIDLHDPDHKPTGLQPDAVMKLLEALPVAPTCTIHSGHGMQTFWLFREPWVFDEADEHAEGALLCSAWIRMVEAAAKRIAPAATIDHTSDLARLYRVAGSVNYKRAPVPCRLLSADGPRYNPGDLLDLPQLIPHLTAAAAASTTVGTLPSVDVASAFPTERHELMLSEHEDYRATWEHTRRDLGADCSRHDMALAAFCVRCGWSDDEITALLVEHRKRHGKDKPHKLRRPDYYARTIQKARESADPAADVEALVAEVEAQETPDPAPVWAAVPLLARVPKAALGDVRRRLKAALGGALNLRDLGAAIAEARQGDAPDGAIVLGRQLRDVTADALALLTAANDPPVLFRRSGEVVRVTNDEDHRPVMGAVGVDELRHRLGALAPWVRMTNDGPRPADPPEVLARNILAAWELPFPGLQAVVESPALRPDGSVLDAPGYDPATLLFYAPAPGLQVPPVPATPTSDQVRAARTLLLDDLLGDFPFADDASRAGALALLLTPILRPALAGHVPLCIVDAPQAGTGKSLLASVVSAVATGRPAAMFSAPRHDEEWAKRLLAVLVAGGTFVLIDNVSGALNSAALCRTLTAHTIADRELGATRILTAPQRATWCVTGNNVAVRGDLPRRCYWVRLEAHCESPWQREGFRHSDLQGWATEERGALLGALLTLCRAWWAAGKPTPKQTPLGSFEEWQRAVGGILALAEVPGFLDNLPALHAELDEESAEWSAFLGGWADVFGEAAVTAREVAEAALGGAPSLAEVLPGDVRDPKTGLVTAAGLGYALRRRRGIYHAGGWRLERTPKGKAGVLWRVVR